MLGNGLHYKVLKLRNFVHNGLKELYLEDSPKGLPADAVDKLTGERKGFWSLHVTRNWRLTFQIDENEVRDVNYEDYH